MTAGERVGENFPLVQNQVNTLGRGVECDVIVGDPLCSRVHAVIDCCAGRWTIRDNQSRNGTFVNNTKIDEATLAEGCYLRVGGSEFSFHESSVEKTMKSPAVRNAAPSPQAWTQTVVRDARMDDFDHERVALGALPASSPSRQLLVLYQLSIRLLDISEPDEVLRVALDVLKLQTESQMVGFLWATETGDLKPKIMLPADLDSEFDLSKSLSQKVCLERTAVWVSNHTAGKMTDSLQHYSDAMCVPLVHNKKLLGAMHAYRRRGSFVEKDFEFAQSLGSITAVGLHRAYRERSLQADVDRLLAKSGGDELLGESPPMQRVRLMLQKLGRTQSTVLIRGESGTGKELAARALHRHSPRADRPLLSVNCAAIPLDLMESQLFGHKTGAFTGADRDHTGYFAQADGGTLFLDEVGEMTLEGQAKLLRILEGHPFLPVGGHREVQVDVRVVAATNQDLQEYVKNRKFREDLYYRLSVHELTLPPLRERGQDVDLLSDFFLARFRKQHGRAKLGLSPAARAKLRSYPWPGNVRQLRNVLDSAVVLAEGQTIEPDDLGLRAARQVDEPASLNLDEVEQKVIRQAMERTGGNIPEAAALLGIGRATLYRKLEVFGWKRA